MANADLNNNIRTMMRRYRLHLESGNHVLREGSQQEVGYSTVDYFSETDPKTSQPNTDGYIVAPGGIGKTISFGDFIVGINTMPNGRFVLGDPMLGKRVMIGVPTNQLAGQWGDRLLGERDLETGLRKPSVFGDRFTEENVYIHRAKARLPEEEVRAGLSKPVVIIVHESVRALHAHINSKTLRPDPLIRPQDFDCLLIDEVDDRLRGDVTGKFYKDTFFPNCLIIGCTATHLFRSGKTVGDYTFGEKKPICEITHEEGVQRKEIAPHVNIIVRPEVDPSSIIKPKMVAWDDYTEAQQLYFIEQTGTDQALLEVIKVGRHPKTGKSLRNMMQLHQAVNVEHGKSIAKELNATFGRDYAYPVWGKDDEEMDDETRELIKYFLQKGEAKAVVQCKLWGRGTDIPALEMTVQHAPSLSPNKLGQFHPRASRKDDGRKIALYLSPFIDGIDQLVIGELLGGLYMIPDGYEFPPSQGHNASPTIPEPWPNIKGVKVYYTQRQLKMFAVERHRQRYVDGLPVKSARVLTLDETAKVLGIDINILRERVFAPVQEAYEKRQAREKFVDIDADNRTSVLHVRGKMFPVSRLGFYQHKGQEEFCVDRDLIPVCEHTLYGRLDKAPPEVLDRGNMKRLLGCSEAQVQKLWQTLQHAFFQRVPYERSIEIEGLKLSYEDFGFYRNAEGASQFFVSPDALITTYRLVYEADQKTADQWAEQPIIRQCKTSSWLTQDEVMEALDLNPLLDGVAAAQIKNIFGTVKALSNGKRTGQEWEVVVGKGKTGNPCNVRNGGYPWLKPMKRLYVSISAPLSG